MPDYNTLRDVQESLIRKPLSGFIALADTSVAFPTSLTSGATAEIQVLPTGFRGLGLISKDDGITFSRDTDAADVESWGELEPTRTDMTRDVTSAGFTCQETRKSVLELYYNVDLSSVTADATSKEVTFNQASSPRTKYSRVIFLSKDGTGTDAIYIAKIMPRAMVSAYDDQNWNQDDPLAYPLTLTAKKDSVLGYSVRHVFGGPGWASRLTAMGFA